MKKIYTLGLIASTLIISTNSYGMLTRISRTTRIKKAFAPQRTFHASHQTQNLFEERIAEEGYYRKYFLNNPTFLEEVKDKQLNEIDNSLQQISIELNAIQKQLDTFAVQHKEKDSIHSDNQTFDLYPNMGSIRKDNASEKERLDAEAKRWLKEIDAHHKRHREAGGFDHTNPYPYRDYEDYVRATSY